MINQYVSGLVGLLVFLGSGLAEPLGTATTYQGEVMKNGLPVDNTCEMKFRLYDAATNGNQVGSERILSNVQVAAGRFTVPLDFGIAAYDGNRRWLEIDVKCPPDANFTTLAPRQKLTVTPYALYALDGPGSSGFWSANGNHIYNTNSGNVGIGTTSPAGKLHVRTTPTYGDVIFFDAGGGQNDLSVDPDSAYTDNTNRVYIVEVTSSAGSPDMFNWSDDNGATWSQDPYAMTTSWFGLSHGVRIKWGDVNGHYDGGALPEDTGDTWLWVAFSSNDNSLVVKEGKVGIGTASPAYELEVANLKPGDAAESAVTAEDASGAIAAYSGTLGAPFEHFAGRVSLFSDAVATGLDLRADSSTSDIRFYTGGVDTGNESMRISDSGNVGIGTVGSANNKLDVSRSLAQNGPGRASIYGFRQGGISSFGEGTDWSLEGVDAAVKGYCSSAHRYTAAVAGYSDFNEYSECAGVVGSSRSGFLRGMLAYEDSDATRWAGYFVGGAKVTGALFKGSGAFQIDHPLDPENKYLQHSFVESPDMMNVYNGNVVLDEHGTAVVEMPEWFEALNFDFRYQLTCIGGFAPVYIAQEISNNSFKIAGGTTGLKVSWQVTGIRQDAFAEANRIPVEVDKSPTEQGKYLHPTAHGVAEGMGIHARPARELAEKGITSLND